MGDDFEFAFEEPAAPTLVLGKKKKKKKPAKAKVEVEEPVADGNDAEGDASEAPETPKEITGNGAVGGFGSLGAMEDEDGGGDAPEKEAPLDDMISAAVAGKKKKKKKKAATPSTAAGGDDEDIDALMAELGATPAEKSAPAEKANDATSVDVSRPAKKGKSKGKAKAAEKAVGGDDDLDALLAELGDAPAEAEKPKPAKKGKGKGKAKDSGKPDAAKDDDDLDALLAELDVKGPGDGATEPAQTSTDDVQAGTGTGGVTGSGDIDEMMAALDGGAAPSANAKKKKKKGKKAAAKADVGDVGDGDAEAATPKKGAKKESTAVRRLREQRERIAAEEARLEQLRKEEEERVAEEERIEAEKVATKERARFAKKEAERARKARLKAEGKLMSKAEAAKKRKAEMFKQQALASGLVAAVKPDAGEGKVVYAKKKRGPKGGRSTGGEEHQDSPVVAEQEAENADKSEKTEETHQEPEPSPVTAPEIVPDEWDAEVSEEEQEAEDAIAAQDDSVAGQSANAGGDAGCEGGNEAESSHGSDDESDSDSFDSDDYDDLSRPEIAAKRRQHDMRRARAKEAAAALEARTPDDLRSPVICILGHVDTGKTKILDRIRRTNVQDGEAGGITQQIGATYFPIEAVKKETMKLADDCPYNVPSLLIIDTPGHESFTNLRSRGSSLCDIAILVIDIMHGLEPQTRESIDLLKLRKTPFVIALNKVDRLYDWESVPGNNPFRTSLAKQKSHVVEEFTRRTKEVQLELAEVGFNTELYWENSDVRRNLSICPTSAITGEGMPDLLMLITSLPQTLLTERLMFNQTLEATVLEVKVIEGLGTTIDIILTGGTIKEGDTIVVVGLDGPIQATIRALLTPHPMKEMRVRGQYHHHKQIRAAQGIKISADGMDKAVAGTQLMVARDPSNADEMAYIHDEVMKDFSTILQNVDKSGEGVYVQASTLGSLEALLEFLRTSEIPVSGINIGPVFKKDVTRASAMLEKRKEFATILAFDVPVERDAREMAEKEGVTIFTADIIYNLFDMFVEHMANHKKSRQEEVKDDVVFPCVLRVLQEHVFNKKDPIVLGVDVAEGILRVGCPLAVRTGDTWTDIGRVVSMEINTKSAVTARAGDSVCVKIQSNKTSHITYGRHFTWTDALVSKMSRQAIDLLKSDFRNELGKIEWQLVIKLKKAFGII